MASIPEVQKIPKNAGVAHALSFRESVFQRFARVTFVIGDLSLFMFQIISWGCRLKLRKGTFVKAGYQIGVLSLPVVGLTGMFIGMVLAVQSFFQFSQIGMESRMGAVINLTLVRELGPVLAATMLAGRVGSAMAAELGTMRVTEQIDAF